MDGGDVLYFEYGREETEFLKAAMNCWERQLTELGIYTGQSIAIFFFCRSSYHRTTNLHSGASDNLEKTRG
ncbi:hypothetical protein JQ038_06315 [Clostridium botulinum]|nr:hypothetical protein [Clostridium botulinum]